MWIANKPFRYRGVRYMPGDRVPAEGWTIRRALVSMHKIVHEVDPAPKAEDYPLSKMKRQELNELALEMGIKNPEGYPNADSLRAVIKGEASPMEPQESDDEDESDDEGKTTEEVVGDEDEIDFTEDEESDEPTA